MKQGNVYRLLVAVILFIGAQAVNAGSFGYQSAPAASQGQPMVAEPAAGGVLNLAGTPEPGTLSMIIVGGLLVAFGIGFKRQD